MLVSAAGLFSSPIVHLSKIESKTVLISLKVSTTRQILRQIISAEESFGLTRTSKPILGLLNNQPNQTRNVVSRVFLKP